MQWYEIFILSTLEIISILFVWSKLNSKLDHKNKKSFFIILIMSVIAVIFDIYDLDFGFIGIFVVLCTLIIALFKVSAKDAGLQFFIVLIIVLSIQFIFTYTLSRLIDTVSYSFVNGLIVNIATLTVCILIRKFIVFDKINQYHLKYGNYMVTIILNIGGIVLLLIYMWQVDKEFVLNHIAYLLFAIIIWEGLNIFFLYQSIRIKQQQERISIHEKYIPFLQTMVHEVRQRQHDFKNHLNALYGLVQIENDQQAKKEIKGYIESLIDGIKPTDQLLNIEDHILSAIIYSKKSLAEEKDILFNVEFQGEIPKYPLEKHELVELLGNLLDNAIEAVENSSGLDNPRIIVVLGIEENSKIIEVRNTGGMLLQKDIDHIFERGFTTKKGKHRGYGLYNVKKIVDYYNGTIELSFEEEYTVFRILL